MEVIMLGTRSTAIALLSLAAVVACHDDDDPTGLSGTATARIANATSTPIDVASGTVIATGNSNIGFGASSGCVVTDVFQPDITVSPTGTTNTFASFTPNLRGGQTYVIVEYPSFAVGAPAFATINTTALPPTGQGGLRVFNAVASTAAYDAYVTAPGAALGTAAAFGIGFRTVSGLIPVTPGTPLVIRLTNAGTQTVAITTANQTFTAGQSSVLVIAPPATGTTVPRTFLVTAC
jgi:hypothetical protein